MKRLFTILCLLLLFPFNSPGKNLPLRLFTSDNGLAFNEVLCSFQDKKGYIWLGTYSGLSQFDGREFRNYTQKNSNLAGVAIRAITQDSEGYIWVGYSGGVSRLRKDGSFQNFKDLHGTDAISLWPDPKKGIWILTDAGANYFDGNSFNFFPLETDTTYYCQKIICLQDGTVYAIDKFGVNRKLPGQGFQNIFQVGDSARGINYNPHDKKIYLISSNALYSVEDDQFRTLAKVTGALVNFSFGPGTIWLQSETQLWKWTTEGAQEYTSTMTSEVSMTGSLVDREGNLWLTTWEGLAMVLNHRIINYNLPIKCITGISKDTQGNFWVSASNGFCKINPAGDILLHTKTTYINYSSIINDEFYTCLESGLVIYDLDGNKIREYPGRGYTYVIHGRSGKTWLGSYDGAFILENKPKLVIDAKEGLGSNSIWTILEDSAGRVWVGTENGLSMGKDGEWSHYTTQDGLSNNAVWYIYESNEWGILFATELGISRYIGNGKFEKLPFLGDRETDDFIYGPNDQLWVGSESGLYRADKSGKINLFLNKSRGLPGMTLFRTLFIDGQYLYVGTYKSMSRIELDIENKNPEPLIDLTRVTVNDTEITTPLKTFNYKKNNFSFFYNAIFAYQPNEITYNYKLTGFDVSRRQTKLRQVNYTNLPHGKYNFEIQAVTSRKKSPIQSLSFEILPPFWLKWWGLLIEISLILCLIISCGFLWSRWRLQKIEDRTFLLELKLLAAEKEALDKELEIAREIQLDALPHDFLCDDHKEFDLFAVMEPAKMIGGDLYDFFLIDDYRICFVIGDVSDKGIPAALFMLTTKALIKAFADQGLHDPARLMNELNRSLNRDNPKCMFVTLIIGIMNLRTGEIIYCNGGHNPPLHIQDGNNRFLDAKSGPFVGTFPDVEYKALTHKLNPGEIFFLYTDGITEAENYKKEQYTEERLAEILKTANNRPVTEIVKKVIRDVRTHAGLESQSDDITVMAVRYNG